MMLGSVLLVQALSSCSLISVTLLSMLMLTWTGCKDYDADYQFNDELSNRVSLAMNISTTRNTTRMADDVTQVNYETQPAREIQELKLFPFTVDDLNNVGKIIEGKTALSGFECDVNELVFKRNNIFRFYYDDSEVVIPDKTASFLCYAQAVPKPVEEENPVKEKFVNGSITATGLGSETETKTSTISFAPEVIHNRVTVSDNATAIATYLTDIANVIKDAGNNDFFFKFINEGRLVACSSTNVPKLAAWATTNGADLTELTAPSNNYPSDIHLPDGAAVVKWLKPARENNYRFVPQPVTTTEANINRLDRFIYPAELWYYANSRIKTDPESRKDDYNNNNHTDWDDVLDTYKTDNGVMDASVHSVAIKDPLRYAVGCLQIGLVVSETLKDAEEVEITIPTGKVPLTAVFVSNQYQQKFNFTPDVSTEEKIIYDPEIPDNAGVTMGSCTSPTPNTATATKFVSTLVFQTPDDVDVRFALEFENNSGKDFQGADGRIFDGTKFYLVGTIDVIGNQVEDYKNRAFTKNYITQGTVRISSLKQAYPYLPDLLDPRLEIAIKLEPKWIQSTTTNVPL